MNATTTTTTPVAEDQGG